MHCTSRKGRGLTLRTRDKTTSKSLEDPSNWPGEMSRVASCVMVVEVDSENFEERMGKTTGGPIDHFLGTMTRCMGYWFCQL
ncbi:hypothetical protein HAX54_051641, partial [Datura stramonium]|nr:hypothetical protein [Datura stramonium]